MKRLLNPEEDRIVPLKGEEGRRDKVHLFEDRDLDAINAAIAAARPLLIKGEPGTGKSQLARAAAQALGWQLKCQAVTAATEPEGLLYELDAVERLAEAQVIQISAPKSLKSDDVRREWVKQQLAVRRFLRPGVLWWGFDWAHALAQQRGEPYAPKTTPTDAEHPKPDAAAPTRAVVLIDEIDKADPSVPNSLLDALGRRAFDVPGGDKVICRDGAEPLVVVTSNDERAIPAAFLRRCLVLHLSLPGKFQAFADRLATRGMAHLHAGGKLPDPRRERPSKADKKALDDARTLLESAALMLWEDRKQAREARLPPPGQAELFDLAWVLYDLKNDHEARIGLMKRLREFTFDKHRLRAPEADDPAEGGDGDESSE